VSVAATVEPVTLWLGPSARGAPDDLRPALLGTLRPGDGDAYVLSQQLSDESVATAVLTLGAAAGSDPRVLLEASYLDERTRDLTADPWTPHGANEPARRVFMAFLRAAVPARVDHLSSNLLHSNYVVRLGTRPRLAVTSANLTSGSLDRHFNALVEIRDRGVAETIRDGFADAWDGDFRDAARTASVALDDGGRCTVVSGVGKATLESIAERIASASHSLRFAMFTFANGGVVYDAIADAL
jgi:hypothetical protein